ncbi:hypothetical protein SUGI_0729270 [Cryptomeria japonica]|nr:hypothetical protein SUGI_0729270 [Cryptomeria japonica]
MGWSSQNTNPVEKRALPTMLREMAFRRQAMWFSNLPYLNHNVCILKVLLVMGWSSLYAIPVEGAGQNMCLSPLDVFRGLMVALMILVDDVGGIVPTITYSP